MWKAGKGGWGEEILLLYQRDLINYNTLFLYISHNPRVEYKQEQMFTLLYMSKSKARNYMESVHHFFSLLIKTKQNTPTFHPKPSYAQEKISRIN